MTSKSTSRPPELSYRDAGVDIDAGNALVERIRPAVGRTHRPGVLGSIGGFGGLFEVPVDRYRRPVLVSATDGVGTKLRLAITTGKHDGIGIDLVAMCVNDILVCGAEPLYFLDYYATGHLDVDVATRVVEGIARGCEQAGAALIGGETAEMPGMYAAGDYDLAGFCVGVVERDAIIDGTRIGPGDRIIALGSSGPHSNGYSLIRRILDLSPSAPDTRLDGVLPEDALMAPTRIYARAIRELLARVPIRGMAHITGGGLTENIPRVLPAAVQARIDTDSWTWPAVFSWLQEAGNVSDAEMVRTFNCGVGMIVIVAEADAERALQGLASSGEQAWPIGTINQRGSDDPAIVLEGS